MVVIISSVGSAHRLVAESLQGKGNGSGKILSCYCKSPHLEEVALFYLHLEPCCRYMKKDSFLQAFAT